MPDNPTNFLIPFNRPSFAGLEMLYVNEAVASGHISGDGSFTKRCEDLLASELGVPSVLLTTSCTHALEMSALLLDIGPGDEVIVPTFTFVSTINAFALRGVRPALRRYKTGHAQRRRAANRTTNNAKDKGDYSNALCRSRLRDGAPY